MDPFLKIFLSMQFVSLVVCSPLPLSIESSTLSSSSSSSSASSSSSSDLETTTSFDYPSTTSTPSTEPTIAPIVFSHDPNPFDPTSISFGENSNWSITKPMPKANATNTPFNGSPIAAWANVIPLPKLMGGHRQQRLQVFRPLFVYRQEQAMKRREAAKQPMDPDRFYPQYPYHYRPYPLPAYGADLYNTHFPEFVPNDISVASLPFDWFETNAHYAWPPQHAFGYFP